MVEKECIHSYKANVIEDILIDWYKAVELLFPQTWLEGKELHDDYLFAILLLVGLDFVVVWIPILRYW